MAKRERDEEQTKRKVNKEKKGQSSKDENKRREQRRGRTHVRQNTKN